MFKLINEPKIGELFCYCNDEVYEYVIVKSNLSNTYYLIDINNRLHHKGFTSIKDTLIYGFNNSIKQKLYYNNMPIFKKEEVMPSLMDVFSYDNRNFFLQENDNKIMVYEIVKDTILKQFTYNNLKPIKQILSDYFGHGSIITFKNNNITL